MCAKKSADALISITDIQEKYIECGSGGGMTGIEKTYFFFSDGAIYNRPYLHDTLEYFGHIEREEYERLSSFSTLLELETYEYQNPGNKYSYLNFPAAEAKERIVWASSDSGVKAACKDVHKLMMQYVERVREQQATN